jgi:hypothetical protein
MRLFLKMAIADWAGSGGRSSDFGREFESQRESHSEKLNVTYADFEGEIADVG